MKQLLLAAAITIACFTSGKTQCLKHVKYTASKMQLLDSNLVSEGEREEPFTFITRANGFTGIRENEVEDSLYGVLKSIDCSGWKEPYKNGKIVFVCDVQGKEENIGDGTITIEAIDGKITISLRAKDRPERIMRLIVDKYEEIL